MRRTFYEKGSFTVEASMIFSMIALLVIALIFAFSYMQQKSCLVNAVSYAAQQGAELWLDSRKQLDNGKINMELEEDSLNYRVFDNLMMSQRTYGGKLEELNTAHGKRMFTLTMAVDSGLPGKKAKLIGEALCDKLEGMVIKPELTEIRITFSNNLMREKLSVEIIQEIKVPFGGIKRFLSGKETVTLACKSTAAVTEPVEYIRNVDFAVELAKRLEGRIDFEGVMSRIKGKGKQ